MTSSFTFSFVFLFFLSIVSAIDLSTNYYEASCPTALSVIQSRVKAAIKAEPRMGASLLRLQFHDCFVNGCDASVLLDDAKNLRGEKDATQNFNSLRGFEVIDDIKSQVERVCPKTVSCADIIAVAARDSVVALGGPSWTVALGRRDSINASFEGAMRDLPVFFQNLTALISLFEKKGFTAEEMVVLSGGHTIGKAACITFRFHIYNETNIDSSFAKSLKQICPKQGGIANVAPLDGTENVFDNTFFRDLVGLKGVLKTDQALYNNGSTDSIVKIYSENSAKFFSDFANAMIKLGNMSLLTGSNGEIRTNCRKINGS